MVTVFFAMLVGYVVGLSLAPMAKGGFFIAVINLVGICVVNALVLFLWYFDFVAYADFALRYLSFIVPLATGMLVPVGLMVGIFALSFARVRDGQLMLFRFESFASIGAAIALPAFFYVNLSLT